MITSVFIAILCGVTIGVEREVRHKPAGIRTFVFVVLGATLCMFIAKQFNSDFTRLPAALFQGIGFLGAGMIWHKKRTTEGITTAALLLVAVAVGILVGMLFYIEALIISLLVYGLLKIKLITDTDIIQQKVVYRKMTK